MVAQVTVPRPRTLAPPANVAPLAGYTLAVASDRRRHPLAPMLEAVGAKVVNVQAVRAFSAVDEVDARPATLDAVAQPIDELLVTSDFGFRTWLSAADGWDLRVRLLARFATARLLASTPRAADALREVGLHEIWSTAAAST